MTARDFNPVWLLETFIRAALYRVVHVVSMPVLDVFLVAAALWFVLSLFRRSR